MFDLVKLDHFKDILPYILDSNIKQFAIKAIPMLPEYFFVVPASSSGKYHPEYATGTGGLLRHTLSAIRIAIELSTLEQFKLTEEEKDLAIVALILHDGWKSGLQNSGNTFHGHPLLPFAILGVNAELMGMLPEEQLDKIFSAIESHMGQWTSSKYEPTIKLKKPRTRLQKFVHMCDYLASRKCITMNFDVPIERRK